MVELLTVSFINDLAKWSNDNSGFLSIILFLATIGIGWVSGIFALIRNKPKFKIDIINQCTFYSTLIQEKTYKGYPVHKTAFVIYCKITNVGYSGSDIGEIQLIYQRKDRRLFFHEKRPIKETICCSDFTYKFQETGHVKVFPFLKQVNQLLPYQDVETYLPVGKSKNGIIYFEEKETYGNLYPIRNKDLRTTPIVIEVKDAYGKIFRKKLNIKYIEPEEALTYNPDFAMTFKKYTINPELQKAGLPL